MKKNNGKKPNKKTKPETPKAKGKTPVPPKRAARTVADDLNAAVRVAPRVDRDIKPANDEIVNVYYPPDSGVWIKLAGIEVRALLERWEEKGALVRIARVDREGNATGEYGMPRLIPKDGIVRAWDGQVAHPSKAQDAVTAAIATSERKDERKIERRRKAQDAPPADTTPSSADGCPTPGCSRGGAAGSFVCTRHAIDDASKPWPEVLDAKQYGGDHTNARIAAVTAIIERSNIAGVLKDEYKIAVKVTCETCSADVGELCVSKIDAQGRAKLSDMAHSKRIAAAERAASLIAEELAKVDPRIAEAGEGASFARYAIDTEVLIKWGKDVKRGKLVRYTKDGGPVIHARMVNAKGDYLDEFGTEDRYIAKSDIVGAASILSFAKADGKRVDDMAAMSGAGSGKPVDTLPPELRADAMAIAAQAPRIGDPDASRLEDAKKNTRKRAAAQREAKPADIARTNDGKALHTVQAVMCSHYDGPRTGATTSRCAKLYHGDMPSTWRRLTLEDNTTEDFCPQHEDSMRARIVELASVGEAPDPLRDSRRDAGMAEADIVTLERMTGGGNMSAMRTDTHGACSERSCRVRFQTGVSNGWTYQDHAFRCPAHPIPPHHRDRSGSCGEPGCTETFTGGLPLDWTWHRKAFWCGTHYPEEVKQKDREHASTLARETGVGLPSPSAFVAPVVTTETKLEADPWDVEEVDNREVPADEPSPNITDERDPWDVEES